MGKWTRKIRGAIGMGLTWALAWFTAGMALLVVVGPDAADVPFPIGFGFLGFLAGVTFSGVLGLIERRTRFEQLSVPRFALWGGVGGVLLSLLFAPIAGLGLDVLSVLAPVFGGAGAICAAGTLALARRAMDAELPAGGDDELEEIGLTPEERRELLGDGR